MEHIKKQESREILARLMANENINIEYRKVQTAAFDIKNRTLILPIWKDISEELHTLLTSHEVGHALYTDAEHIIHKFKEDPRLKVAFNIVEDARIERLIQKKFPGTISSFRKGYKELVDRDFFKSKGKTSEDYKFPDRINLYFKLGINGHMDINFKNQAEHDLVERMEESTTVQEALQISEDLLKYIDENPDEDIPQDAGDPSYELSDGDGDGEGEEVDFDDLPEHIKEQIRNRKNQSGKPGKGKSSIFSETYQNMEDALKGLIDKNATEARYGKLPEDKNWSEHFIADYKQVTEDFKTHYSTRPKDITEAKQLLKTFSSKVKPVVAHLVQVFEMKKRASESRKNLVSQTGILDMNRMHRYKYSDDLFKKATTVYKGKNHGLIMFMDCSGSMTDHMSHTIEQLLTLVMFCKKINIPFEVYGFNDVNYAKTQKTVKNSLKDRNVIAPGQNFQLRQYFSNRMSSFEFKYALINMMALASYYGRDRNRVTSIPNQECLGSTPLNSAILAGLDLLPKFQNNNKLDVVNCVILTDGEATDRLTDDYTSSAVVLRNQNTRKNYKIANTGGKEVTRDLILMLRDVCQINVIGFHLTNSSYFTQKDKKKIIADGFIESVEEGFTSYFHINTDKSLTAVESETDSEVYDKIGDDFTKNMLAKKSKKIMLNKFIEHIA